MGSTSLGVTRIWREREKQLEIHSLEQDAYKYKNGELADAACCLINNARTVPKWGVELRERYPDDRVKQLMIAGALIAAEIDRLLNEDPIRQFARAILHGDNAHRAWLLEAAEKFLEGKEIVKP